MKYNLKTPPRRLEPSVCSLLKTYLTLTGFEIQSNFHSSTFILCGFSRLKILLNCRSTTWGLWTHGTSKAINVLIGVVLLPRRQYFSPDIRRRILCLTNQTFAFHWHEHINTWTNGELLRKLSTNETLHFLIACQKNLAEIFLFVVK